MAPDPEQLRSGLASWVGHLVDDGMNQPLTLSEGARALSIAGESFFGEEQEWVTAGRFRVDMVTRDYGYQDGKWGPGGYTVHLTQLDTFAHPSEAIGSKSLVPELTKAGPTVRLASGGKRRDASLNPIVARTKAALRALAAEHKATPNPLVLSDRAKTLLYSAYLESMDAGYDDSGADREYWDEGDAEETADEKSNGMLPWLIGLGALLMAGGLSDAMLDSRMGQYSATLNPVYEQGFAQGAGAQGTITSVTWHTEEDETVCALCDERDGQVWYGDEEHPYPGDGGYGGEVCDGGPNCFPGDTLVAGQITGAFRMRYSGPVCDLVTASGRALTVTPNHPILTTRGWVRAGMLHEGDEVFSETVSVGDRARDHAHDDPATADEVFDLLAEASAVRARLQTRPGDFYGDAIGGDGHVDVVGADSVLRHGINPASDEGGRQAVLKLAAMQPASLTGDGSTLNAVARITTPTAGDPGGAEEADGVLSLPADVHRLGAISQVDTVATEQPFDSPTSGTDLAAEISRGFPRLVATDKVVHNHVRQFEGHVYDLQTSIGWHTANGIITSNCRCELWYDIVPASETDGGEIGALGALAAGAAAAAFAMDEAGTPDVTDFSDWARVSEDPSEDIGGDLSAVATGTLMKIAAFLAKYNEDQPRDERGRFAGGGVDVGDFARRVRERFGTTQDIQRASFLLPDGTLLARAGTAREGLAGYLYHHTEVIDEVYGDRPEASRPTVNDVMQAGVVRLNARWGGWVDAEMGMRPLTQPQMDVLREAGEAGPHFVLQVSRPGESDGGYSDAAYVGSDFEAATPIYQMLREANAAASGQVVRFTASHDEILRKYSLDQAREPASATKGEGHDVSDEPRDEGGRWTSGGGDSVPVEPGTLPLAPGEIRAYHYTNSIEALHSILKEGLSVGHARGHAYGEPDTLWLSAKMPDPSTHAFIEVHLRPEELNIGGPWAGEHWDQSQIDTFMARGSNFTLAASELAPDRIVTYSEPWHDTYRYMMSEWPPETATADRIAEIKSVATYDDDTAKAAARWLAQVPSEKILKSNPYHDEAGRFTTADGAAGAAEATDPHEKAWEAVGARLDALGKGNCYPAAATIALRAEELGLKNAVVCQGTVTPDHGPLKGVSFGHAWVEADLAGRQNTIRIAYDYSSGNRVSLPASYYRDLGSATDVHEYSREKALALVVGQGHYGPWE